MDRRVLNPRVHTRSGLLVVHEVAADRHQRIDDAHPQVGGRVIDGAKEHLLGHRAGRVQGAGDLRVIEDPQFRLLGAELHVRIEAQVVRQFDEGLVDGLAQRVVRVVAHVLCEPHRLPVYLAGDHVVGPLG